MNTYRLADRRIREGRMWPVVEACYSRTWEHYDMPPHYHNRAEIMYVLRGECLVHLFEYTSDANGQRIQITGRRTERMSPGEFMLLDQETLHALEVPESTYMLNAEFRVQEDSEGLMSMAALARTSPEVSDVLDRMQPMLRSTDEAGIVFHALEQVVEEFSRSGTPNRALADMLMGELLLRVSGLLQSSFIKDNVQTYVQKAMTYIDTNLFTELRVSDIAEAVNIALAYLQRIFKQTLGMTIVEYINRQRIEQSKRLLMFTDDPIVDVAIASGFNSRQHFFRVFSALVGMSPQQFRHEHGDRRVQQLFLFDQASDHSYDSEGNRK